MGVFPLPPNSVMLNITFLVTQGYEILRRARQRDVDRAERYARMDAQIKARHY